MPKRVLNCRETEGNDKEVVNRNMSYDILRDREQVCTAERDIIRWL